MGLIKFSILETEEYLIQIQIIILYSYLAINYKATIKLTSHV